MLIGTELAAQRRGDEQRCQQAEEFGIADMRKRHMQQPQYNHNPHRWQREAAMQRKADRAEQTELERPYLGEILRLPFEQERQGVTEAENAPRHQDRFGAIGGDAGRQHRQHRKRNPTRGDHPAVRLVGDQQGL